MEQDDKVELIDYLMVIWRWKWFIISITFAFIVIAGWLSLTRQKTYELSMAIEPGIIGMNKDGEITYLDSSSNIGEKIEENAYNKKILESLDINPSKINLNFNVKTSKSSRSIKITSLFKENRTGLGLKILNQLPIEISREYEKLVKRKKADCEKIILTEENKIKEIETKRKDIDKLISLKLNQIKEKKSEIEFQKETLKIAAQREKEIVKELKDVKDNTENIINQREALIKSEGDSDSISRLLYSTTIQQNVEYFNQLSNQLNDLREKEQALSSKIDKIKTDIDDIYTQIDRLKLEKTEGLQTKIDNSKANIERLNLEKSLMENIKIVQAPEASFRPVKPKPMRNIALAAGLGLLISVFLAFLCDYIKRARSG